MKILANIVKYRKSFEVFCDTWNSRNIFTFSFYNNFCYFEHYFRNYFHSRFRRFNFPWFFPSRHSILLFFHFGVLLKHWRSLFSAVYINNEFSALLVELNSLLLLKNWIAFYKPFTSIRWKKPFVKHFDYTF